MSKDTTVAARYARALFILTEKRGETASALPDLQALWSVVKPGTRVGHFLSTPQLLLSDKRKALLDTLEGRCLRSVALFLDLLLRKKRLGELETIVREFEALVERAQGIQRAQVVSAVPMPEAERKRLHAELERWTKKKIKLTAEVDPSLVGGAFVRIGDRVVDRSVRTLLDTIGRQLHEASV
jgi:F-type H+-transporting ATPase subunit delta